VSLLKCSNISVIVFLVLLKCILSQGLDVLISNFSLWRSFQNGNPQKQSLGAAMDQLPALQLVKALPLETPTWLSFYHVTAQSTDPM
jgi:hypothetical protein